jgi:type II secretory pathway component PulM
VGKTGVRLWREDVDFTRLSQWLDTLSSQHGAEVDTAAIDRAEALGRVNARLLIQWGDA